MVQAIIAVAAAILARSCLALITLDPTKPCNGEPGMCLLRFNEVTWPGAHNADSTHLKMNGRLGVGCLTDNHQYHIEQQLEDGLRFFDIDTCMINVESGNPDIQICHGPATGRMFRPELEAMKKWLIKNPRELVVITLTNANPPDGGKSEPLKYQMMELLTTIIADVFKDLVFIPHMVHGHPSHGWPTLGELVDKNKRVAVLWGKRMYAQIYQKDKKHGGGFRDQHIWFERNWAMTYDGSYKSMFAPDLAQKLEHFCDNIVPYQGAWKKNQEMILADGYLTVSPTRKSWSFCNKDLAAEVNPEILEETNLDNNPLLKMQANCWKKGRHVSLVSMDYSEYFPMHLDTISRAMNERNFARFGWIGAHLKVEGKYKTAPHSSDAEIKKLLMRLGGVGAERITIEKGVAAVAARRLHSGPDIVEFTIHASKDHVTAMRQDYNPAVLVVMKASSRSEPGVVSITAACPEPGIPLKMTRSHPVTDHFDEGDVLEFTCPAGLVIDGDKSRTCGPDGIFTGIQPKCVPSWRKEPVGYAVFPIWLKLTLLAVLVCCICGCCAGCLAFCVHRCRRKKYNKLEEVDNSGAS